jgi:hypothetical protein
VPRRKARQGKARQGKARHDGEAFLCGGAGIHRDSIDLHAKPTLLVPHPDAQPGRGFSIGMFSPKTNGSGWVSVAPV